MAKVVVENVSDEMMLTIGVKEMKILVDQLPDWGKEARRMLGILDGIGTKYAVNYNKVAQILKIILNTYLK